MFSQEKLIEMSRTDIKGIDKSSLVDIQKIAIDPALPIGERMCLYLDQVKNPYCFLCGDTPVKISFADEGRTLDETVKDHFIKLKSL